VFALWFFSCISFLSVFAAATLFWLDLNALTAKLECFILACLMLIQNCFLWLFSLQMRRGQAKLDESSRTHAVTGLPNRKLVLQDISEGLKLAIRSEYPFALLIVGVDKFGDINNRFTEAGGDSILRQIGEVLRKTCRVEDIVGHFEGDQFLIGAPQTDQPGLVVMSRRLTKALITHSYAARGGQVSITACIGVAIAPPSAYSRDDLLQSALESLKTAKRAGPGKICLGSELVKF
jgi:diguanylate cyclase (GGDEF)-like protein